MWVAGDGEAEVAAEVFGCGVDGEIV